MILKGIIEKGKNNRGTCCYNMNDLTINKVSLYNKLDEICKEDYDNFFDESESKYSLRYVLLDSEPTKDVDLNEAVLNIIYGKWIGGCYSEWTCGSGDADYFYGEGHSIIKELESNEGKYIILEITKL